MGSRGGFMRYARWMAIGVVVLAGGVAGAPAPDTSAPAPDTSAPAPDTSALAPDTTTCGPCVEDVKPPPTYTYVQPAPKEKRESRWFAPRQVAITAGAGVSDFVGSSMRGATETGAAWDARVTVGARSFFAFEAG